MPLRVYDGFIAKCDPSSREFEVLKNGIIIHHPNPGDMIELLCDLNDANKLLLLASQVHHQAELPIAQAIAAALKSD
jgi:hypothetical protein